MSAAMPNARNGMGVVLLCEEGKLKYFEKDIRGNERWGGVLKGFQLTKTHNNLIECVLSGSLRLCVF